MKGTLKNNSVNYSEKIDKIKKPLKNCSPQIKQINCEKKTIEKSPSLYSPQIKRASLLIEKNNLLIAKTAKHSRNKSLVFFNFFNI